MEWIRVLLTLMSITAEQPSLLPLSRANCNELLEVSDENNDINNQCSVRRVSK